MSKTLSEAPLEAPLHVEAVEPPLPKHERLKRHILKAITDGKLEVGHRLPPESELAESHQMSRNTVRQAMQGLEAMGLIRRKPGRGTVVIDAPSRHSERELKLFGLVLPELESPQYPYLQQSFNAKLSEVHGQMIVCDCQQDIARQLDVLMQLVENRVRGVAMVPVSLGTAPAYHFSALRQLKIPLVFCHRRVEHVPAPLVTFSGYDVGFKAGHALTRRGHRRVLFWISHEAPLAARYRQGMRDALAASGAHRMDNYNAGVTLLPAITDVQRQKERDDLAALMSREDRPTAVFASSDTEADRVWGHLDRLGYKVPRDVSIISFGDRQRCTAMQERLTSVTADEAEIGETASHLLIEMSEGARALDDCETIMTNLALFEGASLADAAETGESV